MKQIIKNRKGFSLIEIIVVLAILGIILAIIMPTISGYVDMADDAKFITFGRAVNTEASMLIQEEMIKNPDMSEKEFKEMLTNYRQKFIWIGNPGTPNPINDILSVDLPKFYQIRAIDFNFDGLYSGNEWVYDKNVQYHNITKISIILQKTETDGTQSPLDEFVYIVTLPNKNVFIYNSTEEALEAMDKRPEEGPIFPS